MKISYAITVCNELEEIARLIPLLTKQKRDVDEIVVLLDKPKASTQLLVYLQGHAHQKNINLIEGEFEQHFADWKNKLTSHCTGDYIVNIDADEYPHELLIEYLPTILESNPEVDVFLVPRVNTVTGITPQHITQWGWHLNESGWVNFPDYQWRVYKNNPSIGWINKVHERLDGFKKFSYLPQDEEYALYHPKTIERQEKQNNFYLEL
jgi:glycosyltransferase involved in cell wall biosynthesis